MVIAAAGDPDRTLSRIQLGVSSCLVGEKVRFDGGHKRSPYLLDTLSAYFDFVPICPEVGIGMGVPRPTIRLVRVGDDVRARGVKQTELDVTEPLRAYYDSVAPQLSQIDGYILKSKSPSCGMERVRVYAENGMPQEQQAGLFAERLLAANPGLPIEEEGRLNDPRLRENFIERVFVHRRLRELHAAPSPAALVDFHARHKLLVLAHNQAAYRRLGQWVAQAGSQPLAQLLPAYGQALMECLRKPASRRNHANVLQHLLGYLKQALDGPDKQELLHLIDQYRQGLLPLVVPMTLLKHHFRRHPHPYVARQHYLEPHPAELMLRNHV